MAEHKATLRQARLAALAASPATAEESAAVVARVRALPAFGAAGCVCLYAPLRGELDPASLWAAAASKRIVCAAAGEGGPELRAVRDLAAMVRTGRGFFEPPAGPKVEPESVDLWVVPGLSFDAAGVRLGRGGGYYDRLLARRRADALAIGVIPERLFSAVALPREPHDAAMDWIATETALRDAQG